MEVKLNINSAGAINIPAPQPKTTKHSEGIDATEFSGATALDQSLNDTPGIRPEVVARARELVSQPQYPPTEAIRKIARLLAFNMDQIGDSGL
ncbi:MAG: hypothetical protein JWM99_2569 [Verrucomicrobiales bacterium]|nr:hypothetical protein [Verrucomicrobiales bacterium]